MQTLDGVQNNKKKIEVLFPNCITEKMDKNGHLVKAIDFDKLRQELSCELVEGREERFQFVWPDKKKAILLANSPINATLRPCREESVDFENTENLYIEGDNLDVLKCLKETYLGKVKMIYIDPPYNTGNDFVYEDDFAESASEYLANSGQYDVQGNRLVTNSESNGRFHTDWLNMIYPRLKVSRDLLSEDGVIFISIDDNEVDNLKKICDELFGEGNFVANMIWQSTAGSNTGTDIVTVTENIVVYVKNRNRFQFDGKLSSMDSYTLSDEYEAERGKYGLDKMDRRRVGSHYSDALNYPITMPDGTLRYPGGYNEKSKEGWNYLWSKTKVDWGLKNGFIEIKNNNGEWAVYNKRYFKVDNEGNPIERAIPFRNLITSDMFNTAQGTSEIRNLFSDRPFDFPKPSGLIKYLLSTCVRNDKDAVILDFFSGSATTAHAVMQLNAEDGGNRKFVMVQIPEATEEKSEAKKAGYINICEIGKERVRLVGKKIKKELDVLLQQKYQELYAASHGAIESTNPTSSFAYLNTQLSKIEKERLNEASRNFDKLKEISEGIDLGFRVFKLDSSNMEDIYYAPADYDQGTLFAKSENIKEDRTSEDLLFQVMLELGATLDSKIKTSTVKSKAIYNVADGYIIACFDNEIDDNIVTDIAKMELQYAVFRDSSIKDDSTATNFEQIFKTYSPNTITKVL